MSQYNRQRAQSTKVVKPTAPPTKKDVVQNKSNLLAIPEELTDPANDLIQN